MKKELTLTEKTKETFYIGLVIFLGLTFAFLFTSVCMGTPDCAQWDVVGKLVFGASTLLCTALLHVDKNRKEDK